MEWSEQSKTRIILKRLIGEGANARVFEGLRVDDQCSISQRVAVKILRSKKAVDIWRKEFESIAKIRSIYCVQVFAFDWIEGLPALIMEFVEGKSLKVLLDQRHFSLLEVKSIYSQTLRGLKDLRDQGLHHGDISLDNILIDQEGRIRLIDFGRANLGQATLEFCCPARISGQPPSFASDLYSLRQVVFQICKRSGLASGDQMAQIEEGAPDQKTQVLRPRRLHLKKVFGACALLALCFSFSASEGGAWRKSAAALEVRSLERLYVQIEGGPSGYAPFKVDKIDPGVYRIAWKTANASGSRTLTLLPGAHIVLKVEDLK